ncbi:MAG: 50S ribosomal protein L22 [Bacteroidota bacterium]
MGSRKRIAAEKRKEARKNKSFAVLKNCPTSPRKMRLMADLIRGKSVDEALDILKFSSKEASGRLEKLLMSAIANWQAKNEGVRIEDANLMVSEVFVDSARMLKRIQPAPQGRAHRIRKRSNHVTLTVESANALLTEDTEDVSDNEEAVNVSNEEESEN